MCNGLVLDQRGSKPLLSHAISAGLCLDPLGGGTAAVGRSELARVPWQEGVIIPPSDTAVFAVGRECMLLLNSQSEYSLTTHILTTPPHDARSTEIIGTFDSEVAVVSVYSCMK